MERSTIGRWAFLVGGILAAVLIADRLTGIIVHWIGISGSAGFLAGFILYAVLFFSVLSVIERLTGFRFFRFAPHEE